MVVTRTTGTNAGSYTSTASCSSVTGGQAKCSNYTLTGTTKAFTIGKKTTTVTAASASKTYDGSALTKTSGCASSTNLVSGHTATCTNSGTITNAGSVTNTLSTVVIKDASGTVVTKNYTITKANGTLTVNKKSITVTWKSTTTFTYNGSYQGPSLSSTSLTGANSETVYIAITSGAPSTSAGSYTAKATCVHVSKGSETKNCDNYTLSGGSKAYTISKAKPNVTIASSTWFNSSAYPVSQKANVAGTFNDAVSDGSTSIVQIVSNSSISVGANAVAMMVLKSNGTGTKNITIKFTPTDTTNYYSVTKTFTAKSDKTGPTIPFERFTEGKGTNWCNTDNWLLGWAPEDKNSGVSSTIPNLSSSSSQIKFSVGGVTKSASFGYDCPNVSACKTFYNKYIKGNDLSSYSNFYYMMYKPKTSGVGTGNTKIVIPAGLFKDNVGNSNVKTTLYGATLTSSACK